MRRRKKIVTKIPVDYLWKEQKMLDFTRECYLTKTAVEVMVEGGPITFVIANIGQDLTWIDTSECYQFWKNQAQHHVVEELECFDLDEFPQNYALVASKWRAADVQEIVLLECFH